MKIISHTRWEYKYYLVWITKYRKPVLTGEVAVWLRELVREICKAKGAELIKGPISRNHICIFVSAPQHISVIDLLKALKGQTSWRMLMDFKSLNRQFWGRHEYPS